MGKVTGALSSRHSTDADATAANILSGKKAVVNNVLLTGTYKPTLYSLPMTLGSESVTGVNYACAGRIVNIVYSGSYNFYFSAFAAVYSGNAVLYKNGSIVAVSEGYIPANNLAKCVYTMNCVAGDEIELYLKSSNASGIIYSGTLLAAAN